MSQFAAQVQLVDSHFASVSKISEIRGYVERVAEAANAKRIAICDRGLATRLFPPETGPLGFEVLSQANMQREDFFSALKSAEIGVSVVDLAIAETGTLIAATSDESERLVTALPKMHIALVPRSRLVESIHQAETYISHVLNMSSVGVTVSLISASSRTSDIGDMVILGVHGPKELHVLLIEEDIPGD